MKRIYHYAVLALTLGLGACTQDDAPDLQEQEIRIATRSTSDENATETFTDDFTLELWSTTDNAKHETHPMTYTEGTWNTVKSSILPAHAFAYKGSTVTDISYTDKWNYTVNLQLDQSDAKKLADADVMIATGDAVASTQLALNFEHYFAKVTFNYEMANEFTSSDAITACTVKSTSDVSAYVDVDNKTITAIVGEKVFGSEEELLIITVGEDYKLIVQAPEGGLTFNAGTHYTFNLKVGKNKVELTPTNEDASFPGGWNNDSEENLN